MKKNLFYLLVAGLIIIPATPAFAEDVVSETPVVEESAPVVEETTPETEPAPEPEPERTVYEPNPDDEVGTWSVVDPSGNVVNAIICTEGACGDGTFGKYLCDGCTTVFQQPGQAGYYSDGGHTVTYDKETGNHSVSWEGSIYDGTEYGVTLVQKDGKTLSDETVSKFFEGEESASVTVYSVRQLADQSAESTLVEKSVDISFSNAQLRLSYNNKPEMLDNIETDTEAAVADPNFGDSAREAVRNFVTNIVNYFTDLIGSN